MYFLLGLRDQGFVAEKAARKAEAGKISKHEKACRENQHVFVSFGFDTFGGLACEAIQFLKRVKRVVSENCLSPSAENFVISRVSFAIQKGVAAQLAARLQAVSDS